MPPRQERPRYGYESPTKTCRRWQEMIVPRFFPWCPITHRPGVDDRVVENVIAIRATDGRLARVFFAGIVTWRGYKNRSRTVHAQIVARGIVDEILRIKRAAQMDMQIATFGHVAQER